MKIEIIDVDYKTDVELLTLRECGFQVGDVLEVAGEYPSGRIYVKAIRTTGVVSIGDAVGVQASEYKVAEE
ncbi:hypothetical protein BvCmsC16A_04172 [Escherichia coli]|uniref:hypothetical protein n=1 Tax=Escherichia coli TaxID=562 RepID=UPI0010B45533|nr:hypothetical protein [Escherichia coli]GCG54445.1 hypothetical protein BvCms16BK_04774 [Escherichia coli]GCK64193.1 hypothetical protein BvCmsC16A_04172 [Escherichia coli]